MVGYATIPNQNTSQFYFRNKQLKSLYFGYNNTNGVNWFFFI